MTYTSKGEWGERHLFFNLSANCEEVENAWKSYLTNKSKLPEDYRATVLKFDGSNGNCIV